MARIFVLCCWITVQPFQKCSTFILVQSFVNHVDCPFSPCNCAFNEWSVPKNCVFHCFQHHHFICKLHDQGIHLWGASHFCDRPQMAIQLCMSMHLDHFLSCHVEPAICWLHCWISLENTDPHEHPHACTWGDQGLVFTTSPQTSWSTATHSSHGLHWSTHQWVKKNKSNILCPLCKHSLSSSQTWHNNQTWRISWPRSKWRPSWEWCQSRTCDRKDGWCSRHWQPPTN